MPHNLETELLVTYTRQHRHNAPQRRSQAETPLPWHEAASHALQALKMAVTAQEQRDAEVAGWALLDRGDPPRLAGPCRCGTLLWAPAELAAGASILCSRCGRSHEVDACRRALLRAVEPALVDYGTATRALPVLLGAELATSTLRTWVQRGELAPQAWTHRGTLLEQHRPGARPLLRLGDILDRVAGKEDQCDATG